MSNCNIHDNKNYSISGIRLLSLLMIITCHIFQYLKIELAWWFNVGVQVFLCISGFLYGQKKITDTVTFYKHRFKKILIPYYVVFIIAGTLQFFFARSDLDLKCFLGGLFCKTTINGGGHLWFVGTILLCYVLNIPGWRSHPIR